MNFKVLFVVFLLAASFFATTYDHQPTQAEINQIAADAAAAATSSGQSAATAKVAEIKATIAEKIKPQETEIEAEITSATSSPQTKEVLETTKGMSMAVHSLQAMRDVTGDKGIGQNVSAIATQMHTTVETQQAAEIKLKSRDWFTSLLFGSDETALKTLEETGTQLVEKITQLETIKAQMPLEEQQVVIEQIQTIQTEQNRVQVLATDEKHNKGILGWLFK